MKDKPTAPVGLYPDHTGGWAGSDTSMERAQREVRTGKLLSRQEQAIAFLVERTYMGATYGDLCDHFGWHHGVASGTLSNLHRAGKVARLKVKRNQQKVYVAPSFIGGRRTEEPGRIATKRQTTCPACGHNFTPQEASHDRDQRP